MIDRRTLLGNAALVSATAALGWPGAAAAAALASPFAGTSLETNRLAKKFVGFDMALPAVKLMTAAGPINLARLKDKTRIVTLWAEWCAPCLEEARDFAELQRAYASSKFGIVSILTNSVAKLDHAGALARLRKAGADGLPVLIEPEGGKRVATALAADPDGQGGTSLPCTLLIDARGRVRGRMLNAVKFDGSPRSAWASPSGIALAAGLRDGMFR